MKLILICLLIVSLNGQSRDIDYVNDQFGYYSINNCPLEYINIDSQSDELNLLAAGTEPAEDEGAALVNLPLPFTYYNETYASVVISSNGYLAFANDLNLENGADFSNDCLFPSIPDNQPQTLARIMPFHDDLSRGTDGKIHWAHYTECPLSGHNNPCTIFEWQNWKKTDAVQDFSFQTILIHGSSVIVMQYNPTTPAPESASIGFQNSRLFSGQILSCNQAETALNNQAYCFQNPFIFADGFE